MRPSQNRTEAVSPVVTRALSVLAITLAAMMASTTGSATAHAGDPCPEQAHATCFLEGCNGFHGSPCRPLNVPYECLDRVYTWKCTKWKCTPDNGGPDAGKRRECRLNVET